VGVGDGLGNGIRRAGGILAAAHGAAHSGHSRGCKAAVRSAGVVATSVALIARQAQVSEATVFKYFPTKQALLERVVQDWIVPLAEQLEADVRVINGVRARLALIASRQLADMVRSPQLYVITYRELRWLNYQGSQLQKLVQRWTRIAIWAIEQVLRTARSARTST